MIAAATDALDGYFARLLNQETPLGRQLDPLIDKVIVAGCYIYLATIPNTGVRPWMVTAIVMRELLIQGLRSHLEGRVRPSAPGLPASSRRSSSARRSRPCLLLLWPRASPAAIDPLMVRDVLTWLAVALTLYSGLVYVWIAMPSLRGES